MADVHPDRLALKLNGWLPWLITLSECFQHFQKGQKKTYESILISATPLDDENSLETKTHFKMVEFVHSQDLQENLYTIFVVFIGDNASTTKALAFFLLRFGVVGCGIHQFNFAVKDLVSDVISVVCGVHSIMVKLKSFTVSANLRHYTSLTPIFHCPTSWSSIIFMIKRYRKVQEYFSKISIRKISITVPSAAGKKHLTIFKIYTVMELVSKRLQSDLTILSDVHALSHAVVFKHSTSTCNLRQSSESIPNNQYAARCWK